MDVDVVAADVVHGGGDAVPAIGRAVALTTAMTLILANIMSNIYLLLSIEEGRLLLFLLLMSAVPILTAFGFRSSFGERRGCSAVFLVGRNSTWCKVSTIECYLGKDVEIRS